MKETNYRVVARELLKKGLTKADIVKQLEKIKESKTRIESDLLSSFSEPVGIDVGVTLEPLLEKCKVE
jgi:hypothetical protein